MTYFEFWNNNLDAYFVHAKYYEQKRLTVERDMETSALWNGFYVQNALLTAPIISLQPEKWTKKDTKRAVEKYPKQTNWMMELEEKQKPIEKSKAKFIPASTKAIEDHAKKLAEIRQKASLRK